MEHELLECQCQGVKFYQLRDVSLSYGTLVTLLPEPTNLYNPSCVAAFVPGTVLRSSKPLMLGHVASEANRWICPLLSYHLRVTRYVD